MKAQKLKYYCGPAAVANALECFGIPADQEDIVEECHVTPEDGTDETEVKRALLAYKIKIDEWESPNKQDSMSWLWNHLVCHGPAILCVANHQHWVTVVGCLVAGKKICFWVFDPATGKGWKLYSWNQLAYYWRLAQKYDGPNYYGLGCGQ